MPFPLPRVLGLTQGLPPPVPVLTACVCALVATYIEQQPQDRPPEPPVRSLGPFHWREGRSAGQSHCATPRQHCVPSAAPGAALGDTCPRASALRREDATWVGALRGHCLHLSQARVVRVPKGPHPVGHERIFVAGPGGCLLVRLGSTCWLVSDSRVRPTPTPKSELQGGRGLWRVPSAGGLGGADPGCGESLPRPW